MIVIFKFCKGTGRSSSNPFVNVFADKVTPCPVCKGAGELFLNGPVENYVVSKYVKGLVLNQMSQIY